jgi:hypothetical protein
VLDWVDGAFPFGLSGILAGAVESTFALQEGECKRLNVSIGTDANRSLGQFHVRTRS